MHGRLLQWLGVALVLAVLGAGVGALMIVKDRVRVVITDDQAAVGPDPVALLRDDLGVVARDLGELRTGIGANFERLGSVLEERAEARHADVRTVVQELAGVRQQLDAQASLLQRFEQRLRQLEATAPAAAMAAAPAPEPEPAPEPKPEPEPAVTPTEPALAAAPPKPKGGAFLSFSIPATTFAFDRQQSYQLVPELCRVGFDAKSTLHDFSGVTSNVAGEFTADFDDAQGAWRGEVRCEAGTLVTGVDGRDENLREHLATTEHPQIRFEIQRFVPAANGIDAARQTVRGEVQGRMHIRGVARELTMPVTVEVDASRRVVVNGQVPLRLSDYQVPVPSQLGVINMQDEVTIWIALRARVQAGEPK